jgi:hypothetical protein
MLINDTYTIVNGAWYIPSLTYHIIIERLNGSLFTAPAQPMADVSGDLVPYHGQHPTLISGSKPLPDYIARFYMLEIHWRSTKPGWLTAGLIQAPLFGD